MPKSKTQEKLSLVTIKYSLTGSQNQFVSWELWYPDGSKRIPVSEGGWSCTEQNRKQAEKQAGHYARLYEQKVAQKQKK